MSYVWEYNELTEADQSTAQSLADSLGINPVMGTLLVNRGIRTVEEARRFFRPQLTNLLDPFLFKDMQKAVDRLNEALGKKERILVYGDYDVDGCTAVALVYRFLQQYYSNIDYYIPSRNEEGYGVSRQGVDYAAQQIATNGIDVMSGGNADKVVIAAENIIAKKGLCQIPQNQIILSNGVLKQNAGW